VSKSAVRECSPRGPRPRRTRRERGGIGRRPRLRNLAPPACFQASRTLSLG
jgi:hypothetical protein